MRTLHVAVQCKLEKGFLGDSDSCWGAQELMTRPLDQAAFPGVIIPVLLQRLITKTGVLRC